MIQEAHESLQKVAAAMTFFYVEVIVLSTNDINDACFKGEGT